MAAIKDIFDKSRLESYMDSLGPIDYAEWSVRREVYLVSLENGLRDSLDRKRWADATAYSDDICTASVRNDFDGCDFRRFHGFVVRLADMVEDALLKATRREYSYNPWRILYRLVNYDEGKSLYDMLHASSMADHKYASIRTLLESIREKYSKSAVDYDREAPHEN
jgi:hypothetical protein